MEDFVAIDMASGSTLFSFILALYPFGRVLGRKWQPRAALLARCSPVSF